MACAAATGCAIFTSLDGLSGGPGGAAACDGAADCADAQGPTLEAGPGDAEADAGLDAMKIEGGCPTGRGPEMVRARDSCVDSTEVTVGQYRQFLTAMSALDDRGLGSQGAECTWNTTFTPEYWYPETPKESSLSLTPAQIDARPIGVVDWCDARAFCAWSGKRLCGKVGGGPVDLAAAPTPAGEWFVACSHNGLNPYPYGASYVAGACNDDVSDGDGRSAVKAFPGCTGGYDGLFDMSGNMAEWIDACERTGAPDASTTSCGVIGGPWNFDGTLVRCSSMQQRPRADAIPQIGIRCCADP